MSASSPQSQDRYHAFFEQSSDGIWYFEVDQPIPVDQTDEEIIEAFYQYGYLAECNQAFAEMAGVQSPADLIAMRTPQLIPRERTLENTAFLQRFIHSGFYLTDITFSRPGPEGSTRHFLNNFIGVVENGNFLHAWGIQKDITAQKEAELRLRTILDASSEAIYGMNTEGRCVFINQAACEMFGYTQDECLGENMHELLHYKYPDGSYYPVENCPAQRALQGEEKIIHQKDTFWHKDGSPVQVIFSLSPLNAGTVVDGAVATVIDASELNAREEALRESEERFRHLYDANLIGIAFWNQQFITEANDTFLKLLGYSRQEFEKMGRIDRSKITPAKYKPLDQAAIEEMRVHGVSRIYEKEYQRRDGSRIRVMLGIAQINKKNGEGVAFAIEKP